MKARLAGPIPPAFPVSVVSAAARRIDLGPDGPSVDLRSRGRRERDFRREEYRPDRVRDEDRLHRRQRFDDDRPVVRRGHGS